MKNSSNPLIPVPSLWIDLASYLHPARLPGTEVTAVLRGGRRLASAGMRGLGPAAARRRGPILGWVLDLGRAVALCTIGLGRLILAGLRAAANIEEVPDLVDRPILTLDGGRGAVAGLERRDDVAASVRLRVGRRDASPLKELVRIEGLEERHRLVEEAGHLVTCLVALIALRIERRDASAVFAPLVLPEGFTGASVGGPVLVHIVQ
jgi:hypothetical protein